MADTIADDAPPSWPGDPLLARCLRTTGAAHAEGEFRFVDSDLTRIAAAEGPGAAWVAAFERYGRKAPAMADGSFAVAVKDRHGRVHLAVDRFAIRALCYRVAGDSVLFHERADVLAGEGAHHDAQAIFNYLYFHVIPAPRTVFAGVFRVPAGHCVTIDGGRVDSARWWNPQFQESGHGAFAQLRDEFRGLLRHAVERQIEGGGPVGCFLSGGTDSSTVAGMLGRTTGKPAHTYSIGFDAHGYDEIAYARIAARHFGTDHHEYYVTPRDLIQSIPVIAAAYDQPFGNSSVVPTYFCAKLARLDGMSRILGGDGGDELFGGNSRYAKQRIFGVYDVMPGAARRWMIEPFLLGRVSWKHVPGLCKVASYVEQARVPMPDRAQMYNLLMRMGLADVLTPEFLASIDGDEPIRDLRASYASTSAKTLVNRMLAHDWRYTLAECDLPKVRGAAALAGIPVGFPMLENALVDFSLRLAPELKVKGLRLRWFFKEALRGFLPDATIRKRKQGFGLPFGVWANDDADLKALAIDSVRALGAQGIVRQPFIDRLLGEYLRAHPAYYGEMVWVLMILEQWLRRPRRSPQSGPVDGPYRAARVVAAAS